MFMMKSSFVVFVLIAGVCFVVDATNSIKDGSNLDGEGHKISLSIEPEFKPYRAEGLLPGFKRCSYKPDRCCVKTRDCCYFDTFCCDERHHRTRSILC